MNNLKRIAALLLSATMMLSLLVGCGAAGTAASPAPQTAAPQTAAPETAAQAPSAESETPAAGGESAGTRELTDMEGNTLTIPANPERIAITSWKGAFGACVLLGQLDKVSVMSDTSRYSWMQFAFPQLLDIPDYGSFNNVNLEELVKSNSDIIISPAAAADANQQMRELGLPLYVDGMTPKDADSVFSDEYSEIDAIAEMTGSQATAQEFYAWTDNVMAEIASRVSEIPDEQRKKVLVVRSSMEEVFCENISLGYCVLLAGGKLVTEGINEYYTTVDAEQVLEWNPDFIFQQIVTLRYGDEMAEFYHNWQADDRYKKLTAVVNGDCYIMPMGVEQWAGTIEAPLGTLLMAKLMYPEQFADMDVKALAEEFYSKFLGHTMTDADWEVMAPNFNGAKTTGLSD